MLGEKKLRYINSLINQLKFNGPIFKIEIKGECRTLSLLGLVYESVDTTQ